MAYDVIVVGGGPAGMTAALYALRNGKSVLVLEKDAFGGQMTHSPKLENYPGEIQIGGNELAEKMVAQIRHQGADIDQDRVTLVQDKGGFKVVHTEEGKRYETSTVILATGVKHRMLGLEGEEDFVGDGISFCAVCDGDFYSGQTVCVAGGGNSALQEAILLAQKCEKVIILQDLPFLTGEQKLQDVLASMQNVSVKTGVKITELCKDDNGVFCGVKVEAAETGSLETIACDGLFVAIGLIPENEPFDDLAELNEYGYFDADERCLTMTPGVFVAGDCRSKAIRQVTTAVADGAVAALAACRYLNENKQ